MQTLTESKLADDPEVLRQRLITDGYLFLPGLIDASRVIDARRDAFARLQQHGWIEPGDSPEDAPIALPPRDTEPGRAWGDDGLRSVLLSESFNRLAYEPELRSVVERVMDEPTFAYPIKVFRVVYPTALTPLHPGNSVHQDFVVTGVQDMLTTWIPLGDVSRQLGGLCVRPGSHNAGLHPVNSFLGDGNDEWATTDYRAGDVLLFHCLTDHASLPNKTDRLRMNGEIRWQAVSQTAPTYLVRDRNGIEIHSRLFADTSWFTPVPDGVTVAGIDHHPTIDHVPPSRFADVPAAQQEPGGIAFANRAPGGKSK